MIESTRTLVGRGCLSVRFHPGTPSGPGCVGTDDPALWRHLLWFQGQVWVAELKSDMLNHIPSFFELKGHFERWQGSGKSPWMRFLPNEQEQQSLPGARLATQKGK